MQLNSGSIKAEETPGYLDTPRGQIYHVTHSSAGVPRAAVLMCGGLGAERERAYFTMVRWARALAAQGIDAMRFDYRGIGESPGRFEEMTMTSWREDTGLCAAHMKEFSPGVPLILHGVRMGALIAAGLFAAGVGDAMLLWAPPVSGEGMLFDMMRRTLAAQMFASPDAPRRTREEQFAAIDAGQLVNVDGYFWSKGLCADAARHTLVRPAPSERRPWRLVQVRRGTGGGGGAAVQSHEETVACEAFWESSPSLLCDSRALFEASMRLVDAAAPGGRS